MRQAAQLRNQVFGEVVRRGSQVDLYSAISQTSCRKKPSKKKGTHATGWRRIRCPILELRGLPGDWSKLIREAENRGCLEFHGSRIQYKCAT